MQTELNNLNIKANIIGINDQNKSSGNEGMVEGRDLPWLQDLETTNVWSEWQISYRDIIILNTDNEYESLINVTIDNLTTEDGYNKLMNLITDTVTP